MRNHVMVRVGGGWDTLEHFIEKHDPCRLHVAGTFYPTSLQIIALKLVCHFRYCYKICPC